ncbi:hypothetical protein FHG87_005141 [Trinorchestia longiramus]|nr:hypothetical protein FHG87_005141 [Trinorchestia longiramus]
MACSCCSVHKSVIAIGVMTGILSTMLCVAVVGTYITLEDQVESCRRNASFTADLLQLLPSCALLADASFVLSSRVFLLIQIALWLLLLLFSVLLVIGAIKGRAGLLVPWVVLTLIVMGSIVYDAVIAGLSDRRTSVAVSVIVLAAASACLIVVHKYSRQLRKRSKHTESSTNALLSSPLSELHRHTPPLIFATGHQSSLPRFVSYADMTAFCGDSPPDYATSTAHARLDVNETKIGKPLKEKSSCRSSPSDERAKRPLPSGLGVLH